MHCDRFLLAVFGLVLPASLLSAASLSYTLTDLGPADEFNQGWVNNQGQVTFTSGGTSIFYNGTRQSIPNPTGGTFAASGVNNLGQVVGTITYPGFQYAVGVYAGGAVQVISGTGSANGTAINNAGQIAGLLVNSYRAFLYSGGAPTTINPLPGDGETIARAINEAGDVLVFSAGNTGHAAIFSHGVLTMVPGSAGLDIQPEAMNNAGQVVGYGTDNNHPIFQAVLLSNGQAMFLGAPSGGESFANAINDSGFIVGDTLTGGYAATVYDPGTGWLTLSSLVTNGTGWTLEYADSINDQGQIAGIGRLNGVPSAYLLTPVPEPSTVFLLGVAAFGLGVWVRRHPKVPH
jgi:hypothetical protein